MDKFLSIPAALLITFAVSAVAADGPRKAAPVPGFGAWLDSVQAEARQRGWDSPSVRTALRDAEYLPRVIELDRKQPSRTFTLRQYLDRVVTEQRVQRGTRLLRTHRALLDRVANRYGVQPRFIVALWGLETSYGSITGGFSVISALATLAYDGRRSAFFRKELLNALKILDEGHITPDRMKGSWAGAMGQSQFMPSSFLTYAVDYNRDGKRDIWSSLEDVFASAANYLSRAGWRDDQTWGREVRLPGGFDPDLASLKVRKRLSQWQRMGIRRADGRDLPTRDLMASVVWPSTGVNEPAYVVYNNYRVLLRWNRSHHFAVSVGLLSNRIAGQ